MEILVVVKWMFTTLPLTGPEFLNTLTHTTESHVLRETVFLVGVY